MYFDQGDTYYRAGSVQAFSKTGGEKFGEMLKVNRIFGKV